MKSLKMRSSISGSISYLRSRENELNSEISFIQQNFGKRQVSGLVKDVVKYHLEADKFTLLDIGELVQKSFLLTRRQAVDAIYELLE